MTESDALRDAAASYTAQGMHVIPLHDVHSGACSCALGERCAAPGKHPVQRKWNDQTACVSTPDVWATWEERPHANVGIVTGVASGVFVLDVDPDKEGFTALRSLITEHGVLPPTRIHQTGSGGLHYFYCATRPLPTTAGSLGRGLDTRAENGMVVAPPSVSGKGAYTVLIDTEPADAPAWLLDRLDEVTARRAQGVGAEVLGGAPLDIDALPIKLRDRLADLSAADRSTYFHGSVAACRRAGLSQGQTVTALHAWCEAVGKYAGRVEAEVARSWAKLDDAAPELQPEAWIDSLPEGELADMLAAARTFQDVPDPGHIFCALAVAATRDMCGDPTWLLLVAPPSSGKTETVRALDHCTDAHLDDVTVAGLLSWKSGKNPRPTGLLTRIGDVALVTLGDLSTLLADSDNGSRDTIFALLRKVYDGHVVRDLGSAPEPLTWRGRATLVGAVTGVIDNYAAHSNALGPRWVYYRLRHRDTAGKRRAAALARRGELAKLRDAYAARAARVVYAARTRLPYVEVPESMHDAIEDAALVCCWGRASVPRHGYGRREIDGMAVVEEPPRLVKQLAGLAAGLLAMELPGDYAEQLVRRVAMDSMPAARAAVLHALAASEVPLYTAHLARAASLNRNVARRNLEELEQIGVVRAYREGAEPEGEEPDRRPCAWVLSGEDGELVAHVLKQDRDAPEYDGRCPESGFPHPPSPPIKEKESMQASPLSGHPLQQVNGGGPPLTPT